MKNICHLADCMDHMRSLPDKHYNLAIVDPPYGIGNFSQGRTNETVDLRHREYDWNNATPNKEYFNEILRVSKEWIIWGANYYNCFDQKGGAIVWFKHVKHPNMSKCEIAACSHHKKVEYVDLIWQNVNRGCKIIHPCQKPVALYKWLLSNYAKPGDRIFDSHVGSGSIRIACHDLDFDFEGCEIDADYHAAQEARFIKHTDQLRLL